MAEPLIEALRFAYTMRRKNKGKDIPYDGVDLTTCRLLAGMSNNKETLTADSLEYHEERDRDAARMIISCAIRLGIEQGWRMLMDDTSIAETYLRDVERYVNGDFKDEATAETYRQWAQESLKSLRKHVKDPGLIIDENDEEEE
jgi:hypothetical protein